MKSKKKRAPTPAQIERMEIARDLGLEEKILALGWGELTAEESGRIGGILSGRRRLAKKKAEDSNAVCGAGAQLRPVDEAGSAH